MNAAVHVSSHDAAAIWSYYTCTTQICYGCPKIIQHKDQEYTAHTVSLLWKIQNLLSELPILLAFEQGRILENIGICSQVNFVRYMQDRKILQVDPKLLIKDLWFEKVPVRIYQPKAPSASERRGVTFFHGGGWVFGSVGKISNRRKIL